MLSEYSDGHHKLAQMLLEREVIYTEDMEHIFGKRKWTSRNDIIEGEEQNKSIKDSDNTSIALPSGEKNDEEPPQLDDETPPVFTPENIE